MIPLSFHHCSASLGSHSGSVPHSASVVSGSRSCSVSTTVVAPLPAESSEALGGPSRLSKEDKELLLEYLGIECDLPSLGPAGLPAAYQKFKPLTEATPWVLALSKDHEWNQQFGDRQPWIPRL